MKRIMVLCLVMALLATMTIGVSATTTTYVPGEDGKYNVTINVANGAADNNAGQMYGFVAVPGTGEGIAVSENNIVYIDQATADANGNITFTGFLPKGAAPGAEGWVDCTLFVGGTGYDTATVVGILSVEVDDETNTVKITGKVKDDFAGTTKDATVTVYDDGSNVVGEPVIVAKNGDGKFSIDVPANGTYSVKVEKKAYLPYTYTGVAVDEENKDVDVIVMTTLAGDVDENGIAVDFFDLTALLVDYDKTSDFATPAADLDANNSVDFFDLTALLSAYDKVPVVEAFAN